MIRIVRQKITGILYKDGSKIYRILPFNVKIGDSLLASSNAPLTIGNTLPLKNIPLGTKVFNIEPVPGRGGKFVRAAGTSALLLSKFANGLFYVYHPNKYDFFPNIVGLL